MVGLGIDLTSIGVKVEHPTDPNADDLPPQPLLLVRRFVGRGLVGIGWSIEGFRGGVGVGVA